VFEVAGIKYPARPTPDLVSEHQRKEKVNLLIEWRLKSLEAAQRKKIGAKRKRQDSQSSDSVHSTELRENLC
jgi:hypothetical protein